jgi:tetratricopeptide (TPR) repeat protein
MLCRCHLCAAVLAVGGLLLSGCGTARLTTKSSTPTLASGKSGRAADGALDKLAAEKLAKAHAHYAAGVVHELNEEADLALEEFSKAALNDPENELLVLDVSRRFLIRRQPEKALELLTNATARVSASCTNTGFLIDLAELYADFAKQSPARKTMAKTEALAALDRAAKLKPANARLRLRLAEGFNSLGETAKAVPIYLELLKQPGPQRELPLLRNAIRAKLADIYRHRGDWAGAAEQLEGIVHDDPTNPQGYYYLGSIAFEGGKLTNAVEYFAKTILFDPDFEQAYYDLASVQVNLNQTREALVTLEKARAKFSDNFVVQFLSGMAHSQRKEYAEAIKHFTSAEVIARATQPKRLTPVFFFQLGSAYERKGDVAEAEKYFEKAIELDPGFGGALNYLGYMWAERGVNLDKARELIERAVKAEPKNAAFLDSLGWVLFKLNQPQAALKQLLKAIEYDEEPDATIYNHLGDVHAALNQAEKAREAWRKSLKLEPNEQVQKKLEGAPVK